LGSPPFETRRFRPRPWESTLAHFCSMQPVDFIILSYSIRKFLELGGTHFKLVN
jgi:hypothetical protein